MAELSFTERAPHEAGFAQVVEREIAPLLARREGERQRLRRRALAGMVGAGGLGLTGAGAAVAGWAEPGIGVAGAVVGGAGSWGVKAHCERRWQARLGADILPILCRFLGDMRYAGQAESGIDPGAFERLGLVPRHHRARLEDGVVGHHAGIHWSMAEAALVRRRRVRRTSRSRRVFRGLLVRIRIDGPAPRILFARDRGWPLNRLAERLPGARRGLTRIAVGGPEFEAVYATYTNDPVAARAYLDDRFVDGLLLVARHLRGGGHLACAMEGDGLYLALPRRRDMLALGSLFAPVSAVEEDLRAALDDLTLPRKIIAALSGR